MYKPELLAPAGNLEKLKTAILYGADAVYLGHQKFGLRAASDNFSRQQLKEAADFAHERGRKIYLTLNSFFHDEDFEELKEFLEYCEELSVDALIASDLGVVSFIRKHCSLPIHLSTQASCLNTESARFWKKQGVSRIIFGRECSVAQAGKIKKEVGIEVELFIHGSQCMSYSGHCVISNYTAGRDSNRGGCAHSCRFEYSFPEADIDNSFFLSSKDLKGLEVIPDFFAQQIDSVKIEGRMKSSLYVGTSSKVYREALDCFHEQKEDFYRKLASWSEELEKFSHRSYTEGNLVEKAGSDSIHQEREAAVENSFSNIGQVLWLLALTEAKQRYY